MKRRCKRADLVTKNSELKVRLTFFFDFMISEQRKVNTVSFLCVSVWSCRTWRWALWSLCEIALQRRSEEVFVWSCRFVYKNVRIFWALQNFKRLSLFKRVHFFKRLHKTSLVFFTSSLRLSLWEVQATMLSLDRIMLPVLAKGKMKNSDAKLQERKEWKHWKDKWNNYQKF